MHCGMKAKLHGVLLRNCRLEDGRLRKVRVASLGPRSVARFGHNQWSAIREAVLKVAVDGMCVCVCVCVCVCLSVCL